MNIFLLIVISIILISVIVYCEIHKKRPISTFIDKNDGKTVKVYLEGYDSFYVPTYRYEKEGEKPLYQRACKRG